MAPLVNAAWRASLAMAATFALLVALSGCSQPPEPALTCADCTLTALKRMISEADSLFARAQPDSSIALYNLALQTASDSCQGTDSITACIFWQLGKCYRYEQSFARADSCWRRAVQIGEKRIRLTPLELIRDLENLGQLDTRLGNLDEAKTLLERALDIRKKIYGADSPEIVGCMNMLAWLSKKAGDLEGARGIFVDGLRILERTRPDPDSVNDQERLLRKLIDQYSYLHRDTEVEDCCRHLLDLVVKEKGAEHRDVIGVLLTLVDPVFNQGKISVTDSLIRESCRLSRELNGATSLQFALDLQRSAAYYRKLTNYHRAESLQVHALEILQAAPGSHQTAIAQSLSELGIICTSQARFEKALEYFGRAEEICRKTDHPESIGLALVLNWYGNIDRSLGRNSEAEAMYKESLRLRALSGGPQDPSIAEASNNLGELRLSQERYTEAIDYYRRALELREAEFGSNYGYLDHSLVGLGNVYNQLGDYAQAESFLRRAQRICDRAYQPDHVHFSWIYQGLAACKRFRGDYSEAEPDYLRALAISTRAFGESHSETIPILNELALLYGSMSEPAKAVTMYRRLLQSRQDLVGDAFTYLPEEQKLRFVNQNPLMIPSLLSLALLDTALETRDAALEMILRGKAAVLDAAASERRQAYCSYDEGIRQTAESHAQICGAISTLSLAAFKADNPQEYRGSIDSLSRVKDSLETLLSACSQFREELTSRRFSTREVAQSLTSNAVLWEYVCYTPYDFRAAGTDRQRTGEPRFMALSLDNLGKIMQYDLGEAHIIDSLVTLARSLLYEDRGISAFGLAKESEERLAAVTGELHRLIFAPLERHLDGRDKIFVSPDGQLSLLPFEILPSPDGSYVIEKYRISYLSSGRDVLKFRSPSETSDWALLVSDPDYVPRSEVAQHSAGDQARGLPGCLREGFEPLPHTLEETDSILATLRGVPDLKVTACSRARATEDLIKGMDAAPRILHLATHGFFCEHIDSEKQNILDNPLLRSGLALANANRLIEHGSNNHPIEQDGILTAFEISGLNLYGTELAVLSSCETGLGKITTGEGVFGLRRAFQIAGARTVIMSLWKVSDQETSHLMTQFYRGWMAGASKSEALRQSILAAVKSHRARDGAAYPGLWGAFVLVGDPN